MKLTYSFDCNKEELCMDTKNFLIYGSFGSDCRLNCIFNFFKKLNKPINGKSFDYELTASVTLIHKPYEKNIYIVRFRDIYINDDRPGYPNEDQVMEYFKKKYAHLCANMLITTLEDRIRLAKKLKDFSQFHANFFKGTKYDQSRIRSIKRKIRSN